MTATVLATRQYADGSVTVAKLATGVTLDAIATANATAGNVSLNSNKLINVAAPTTSTDAATKGYVDGLVSGALVYQGVLDCSTNPNYPAATAGYVWIVSVAGKIGGASGLNVEVQDLVICKTTNAGGDQATAGAYFNIVQANVDGAVTGPASATDSAVALFDGTSGKIIKNSTVTVDGSGNIITNGSLGSTGSRVVKVWATDMQVTNAIAGSVTGNAATVTTNANLTGPVTSIGNATSITANAVTNGMLATVSTATFKGRATAGAGNPEDLTATQATALLNEFVGDSGSGGTKGLVPAPASGDAAADKFLKADGTWAAVPAAESFSTGETPSGSVNGINVTFTLANTPVSGSVALYLNGMRLKSGAGNDYTISTDTITMAVAPLTGEVLQADYRY